METATTLMRAWTENVSAQTKLDQFLSSPTGRAALTLLKELNRPVQLQKFVAGIDPDKIAASTLNQAIGWNRCIDQLVAMTNMRSVPDDDLMPWEHYGESENQEPT